MSNSEGNEDDYLSRTTNAEALSYSVRLSELIHKKVWEIEFYLQQILFIAVAILILLVIIFVVVCWKFIVLLIAWIASAGLMFFKIAEPFIQAITLNHVFVLLGVLIGSLALFFLIIFLYHVFRDKLHSISLVKFIFGIPRAIRGIKNEVASSPDSGSSKGIRDVPEGYSDRMYEYFKESERYFEDRRKAKDISK